MGELSETCQVILFFLSLKREIRFVGKSFKATFMMGQPRAPHVKKGGPGGGEMGCGGKFPPRDLEVEVNPLLFCGCGNVCLGVPSFTAKG